MIERRGNWQKLSSKIVHANPFYRIREDTVIKPNGDKGFYNVVEGKDSVYIVALDHDHNVFLVELHRYTNNNLSIEIPAGGVDGQEPLMAARRELKEETGLVASSWTELGVVHPANGIVEGKSYVFLAQDLKQTADTGQEEEGIVNVLKIPLSEAMTMIKNGRITDSETIAPLTLAALHIGFLSK